MERVFMQMLGVGTETATASGYFANHCVIR